MSASFHRLANTSLKEQVVRELERSILSGDLQPGDRLPPERELAEALGISRSLVNLAILELESRGFVRIVPRRGTFVNDYMTQGTPQMLLSLMDFDSDKMDWTLFGNMMDTRRLLECECTRLAIRHATEEDLGRMREALRVMERCESPERFVDGNFRLHHALTIASGNAIYAMIFNSFGKALHFFIGQFFSTEERRSESVLSHRALLETLVRRDETAAMDAIRRTLDTGITGLSDIFKP
jgi:GntR family transcriptional regulator, transcriptional repressor for pyruvate dehydrogenase complex